MRVFALADIGSTFTKVVLVDADNPAIVAREQAPSTVETDVNIGFEGALARARASLPQGHDVERIVACSSAAGGLRVVAVGLVPDLTVEAARRAALGAGAKLVGAFGYRLTARDGERLTALKPDIVLLAGGTDGGDMATILHNARAIAQLPGRQPIVVAGNREVADEAAEVLAGSGCSVRVVENVMPEFGELNIEPAREALRETFIAHIVQAKGLDKLLRATDGVVMPTPLAVVKAAEKIAESGALGGNDLVLVDVGGATTDVVSIAEGKPTMPGVIQRGLPEPKTKRTVEGDLGLRHNAISLLEAAGEAQLAEVLGEPSAVVRGRLSAYQSQPSRLASTSAEMLTDVTLAKYATTIAMRRHAGELREHYMPGGERQYTQVGKDLCAVPAVVGTGGALAFSGQAGEILAGVLYDERDAFSLRPKRPRLFVDSRYVLFAVGLLAEMEPKCAEALAWDCVRPIAQALPSR